MNRKVLIGAGLVVVAALTTIAVIQLRPSEFSIVDPDCPDDAAMVYAFTRDSEKEIRHYDIYGRDREGTIHRLTEDATSDAASFSPDGEQIVFVSGRDGAFEECCGFETQRLYVMDSNGENERPLLDGEHDHDPDWSPTSDEIAFAREFPERGSAIYVVDAGGGDPRLVTGDRDGSSETDPSWSPDGERIAFIGHGEKGGDVIYVVGADGGEPQRVASELGEIEDLSWSPDGETFVFAAGFYVYTVTFEEPNPRLIERDALAPVWSHDGSRLAYYSEQESPEEYALVVAEPEPGAPEEFIARLQPAFSESLDWLRCP